MKRYIIAALAMTATSVWAADKLTVEVGYSDAGGLPPESSGKYPPNPDTSFVTISNTGTSDFEGFLSLTGFSGYGTYGHIDVDDSLGALLHPGESRTLYGGDEGSNYGGYNKCQTFVFGDPNSGQDPTGDPDNGMLLHIGGTFVGGPSIDYNILDHEIHSGVSQPNGLGLTLDNYILQGADPFGRDTGDGVEEAQAHALFDVTGSRTASPIICGTVPETGSTAMLLASGIAAIAFFRRKLAA